MRSLLLVVILAVAAHPLRAGEKSTEPTSEPIFQQLLDRIASLEKRIAALEAAGKRSSVMPVLQPETPQAPFATRPALPKVGPPMQSGPSTAYPQHPPQRPLTVPDGPANQWNRIEINGQHFYIVPATNVSGQQAKMPNYVPR